MARPGIAWAKQISKEFPNLSDLILPDGGDQRHRRGDDLSKSGSACPDVCRSDHASPVHVACEAQRWSTSIGQLLQTQEHATVIVVIGQLIISHSSSNFFAGWREQ